ncbi:MAG: hypothetical protein M3Q65_16675 [Chloroflexota bacterium]|nr:hypothetical protein [Chloroflexota bacterium]
MARRSLWLIGLLLLAACGGEAPATVVGVLVEPSPTATATPSPTATPTVPPPSSAPTARPAATATRAARPEPNGTVPAGWRIYRGPRQMPFVIAYPPDWEVDESEIDEGQVAFISPSETEIVLISASDEPEPDADVDALREQFYRSQAELCDRSSIDTTGTERISGLTFASLGATCDSDGTLFYVYSGIGLNDRVPWFYLCISTEAAHEDNARRYFRPMVQTLNIYANP